MVAYWFQRYVYFCTNMKLVLVCYATTWLHVVLALFPDHGSTKFAHPRNDERYSKGLTMLFAQLLQATSAAARAELCYISLASLVLAGDKHACF